MSENSNIGNSNRITRDYLDSLLVEWRFYDSDNPTTEFDFYGEQFRSPIMPGALSHLDESMRKGVMVEYARGAYEAGVPTLVGMTDDATIEEMAATGARVIEIIKPYADRDKIFRKIEHANKIGLLGIGIDIDHPYGPDGSPDIVDGEEMRRISVEEMRAFCKASGLPLIAKGVLSTADAYKSLEAGCGGLLLSHHNNRLEYAVPALKLLPEIKTMVNGRIPILVDGEIRTGMDAFKALALGADAVNIGRPLMKPLKEKGSDGVKEYLEQAEAELAKAMAFTGCIALDDIEASIIHHRDF